MHSIRTKTTLINVIAIAVATIISMFIAVFSAANLGHSSTEQAIALLCEEGKNNLNYYFKSVEQSVNTISSLVDANLDTINPSEYDTKLPAHMEQARTIFKEAAKNTNGVVTYYYRIDPSISETTGEKGFWYINIDGKGFVEHEVTDLSDDQYECVWFYTPKNTGKSIWLPPYITDNLPEYQEYVLSYNVPVYNKKNFIGVIGIEISYHTLGEQIKDIKALKSGFAYIVEDEYGTIVYHPTIDILSMKPEDRPKTPDGFSEQIKGENHHFKYTYEGVLKHAHWLKLGNDMTIVVAVPASEVNESWIKVAIQIIVSGVVVIAAFATLTTIYSNRLTKPLKQLTLAAEKINEGDYNVELTYRQNNEIGVLSETFNKLVNNMGEYIKELNNLAYADSLTAVKNKSAFDSAIKEIQARIDNGEEINFAIAMFDCDNLKQINDNYGHDKGNVYLKNTSLLICRVFQHSTVYRLGGDEFVVILEGEDYTNRRRLRSSFIQKSKEICIFADEEWEKVRVSVGVATYDPEVDSSAEDVVIHADHLMYDNKREKKKKTIKES